MHDRAGHECRSLRRGETEGCLDPSPPPTPKARGKESPLCLVSTDRTEENQTTKARPNVPGPPPGAKLPRVFFSSALRTGSSSAPPASGQGRLHVPLGSPVADGPSWGSPRSAAVRFPSGQLQAFQAPFPFSGVEIHFRGRAAQSPKSRSRVSPTPGGATPLVPSTLTRQASGCESPSLRPLLACTLRHLHTRPSLLPGSEHETRLVLLEVPGPRTPSLLLDLLHPPLIPVFHFVLCSLFPTSPSCPMADEVVLNRAPLILRKHN